MASQAHDFLAIIDRELQSLEDQIRTYPGSDALWAVPAGISNSGGSLAVHLCGNLRHFIGARLGNSGYSRDRNFEFSGEPLDADSLLRIVDATRSELRESLQAMDDSRLEEAYPDAVAGVSLSIRLFLVHLISHLGYHLGQIDYHRRLVTGENRPVGTLSIPKLLVS